MPSAVRTPVRRGVRELRDSDQELILKIAGGAPSPEGGEVTHCSEMQ